MYFKLRKSHFFSTSPTFYNLDRVATTLCLNPLSVSPYADFNSAVFGSRSVCFWVFRIRNYFIRICILPSTTKNVRQPFISTICDLFLTFFIYENLCKCIFKKLIRKTNLNKKLKKNRIRICKSVV